MSTPPANQPSQTIASPLPLGDLLARGSHIRSDITPEGLLHEVAETIQQTLSSQWVYVRLRNPETDALEAVACTNLPADVCQQLQAEPLSPTLYQALLQPAFRISESFLVPADQSARVEPNIPTLQQPLTATLLVLMRGRGDRLLGVVYSAVATDDHTLLEAEVYIVEAIVRQAALALENVRLAERSARLLAKEQLLVELGRDVSATLDLPTILARTVARLEVAFGSGALTLLKPDSMLEVVATADTDAHLHGTRTHPGDGLVGWVAQHGQSYFTNDTATDPRCDPLNPQWALYRSCIVVPLRSGGQVFGTLHVGNPQPGSFSYADVDLLEAIAAQVGGPLTSARLYQELEDATAQIQRRADQLAVLNALARTAATMIDQTDVVPAIAGQIREGFGYSHVDLFLLEEETSELVLASVSGTYYATGVGYRQHVNLGVIGRAVRSGLVQQVDDVRDEPDYFQTVERTATRSELCVPITANGRVLAVLNLEALEVATFTKEDVAVLETVADVLAGALENVRLYKRAQTAAVLEERNRLARELHDSVTQQLFSMTLTAQAARVHIEKNPQRAASQLERLQETASAALAEMRALIMQLRPPALRDQGLVAALQQEAGLLSRREGLRIELSVTGDERLARSFEQPLYRIVQEALNNVVKHAQANNASVGLEFTNAFVRVRVSDDGQGFDIGAAALPDSRHLGMLSMRERAAEIGGTMDVRSTIGGGTEVVVTIVRAAHS